MEGSETKIDQGGARENCKICLWLEEWAGTPTCGAFCIRIFESVHVKSLYDPRPVPSAIRRAELNQTMTEFLTLGTLTARETKIP